MRQKDRARCFDAAVKREAECNTDHQLLLIKLRFPGKNKRPKPRIKVPGKFDVSKLSGGSVVDSHHSVTVDADGNITTRVIFQDLLVSTATARWKDDGTVEEKWASIRSGFTEVARETMDTVQHNRPDWFRESAMTLEPLLEERNRSYERWLCSRSARDRQKFVRAI